MPLRRWTAPLVTLVLAVTSASTAAQRPVGTDTLSARAVAESLKVLKAVRAQLDQRKNRNNAALWYHRAMLTWALYLRDRAGGGLPGIDWTLLNREADSSMRIASSLAPSNVRYQLSRGEYYASTGWMPLTVQSFHVMDVALASARKSKNKQMIAEAAVEKARIHWRRYGTFGFASAPPEVLAAQRTADEIKGEKIYTDRINQDPRNSAQMQSLHDSRDFKGKLIPHTEGEFSGEVDYYKSEDFFREAYAANPSYAPAFAGLAMVMEERHRWPELKDLAQKRVADDPHNAWGWLVLGLGLHRTGNSGAALTAFDKGLALLDPKERARLDDIARVIRPSDSLVARAWTANERKSFEDWYWEWSAPLWSLEVTKPRAEFLARLTAAEIRWTSGEFGYRGADTDRGNLFVRYGPSNGGRGAYGDETWRYNYTGLAFYLHGAPAFGTAYFANIGEANELMDSIPARWDNLVHVRVDSMPLRTARFRTQAESPDSLDVVFTLHPEVAEIRQAADLDIPVNLHFWLLGGLFPEPQHDTSELRRDEVVTLVKRLHEGEYPYRVEATNEASAIGARASSKLTARNDSTEEFFTTGFGVSDLLVGSYATPRGTPRRWTDFNFKPEPGPFVIGADMALVWENYDLGERNGSAEYSVRLIIEHKWQMVLNKIRARVISAWAAMIGTEQTSDRVIFHYDRAVPYDAVIPDYITLTLTDAPAGYYDVTMEITDKVTGKIASRTTRIRVNN